MHEMKIAPGRSAGRRRADGQQAPRVRGPRRITDSGRRLAAATPKWSASPYNTPSVMFFWPDSRRPK